jgi:cation transport regulator ChaC
MKYFAYGSNMYTPRMKKRVPSADNDTVAVLPKHVLRWHKVDDDGSGKCNVFFTGNIDDVVYGVVFKIPDADIGLLDHAEGVGTGYERKTVILETNVGAIQADVYKAAPCAIDENIRPYGWYRDLVLAGAREHGFSVEYVEEIENVEVKDDPDSERAARNHEILEG